MHKLLIRKPDSVVLLVAAYFIVEFLVRLAIPHSLRYDESQQVFFSQWLELGYDSQPPLYNWFQTLTISTFGLSLAAVAIVKNLMLFLVYASYYWLARQVLNDKVFAVIATLSLLTIPQLFWEAQRDLTHSVAQLLTINLFLCCAVRTLKSPSTASYLLTGIALGLGLLSKYNFVLLPAATIVAVWFHPEGRARLFDKRFLLTVVVALLIFLPHGLWLAHHFAVASGRTLGIMEQNAPESELARLIRGPLVFLKLIAIISAPTVLVFAIVFGKEFFRSLRASSQWTRFFETIFIVVAALVLVLILAIGMTALRDRWLLPFLFLVPIYLCLKMEAAGVRSEDFARRFLYIPLAMMLLIPAILFSRVTFPILLGGYYEAYHVPYASFVNQIVTAEGKRPGLVVTDDWPPAGNLRMQLPDVPVMSMFFGHLSLPYSWSSERPILVVWLPKRTGEALPSMLGDWLRDNLGPQYAAPDIKKTDVGYLRGKDGDAYSFAYSWIYPK
ncbi:glycosyltransferase family 39 protein [Rhizobium sp. 2YAF20]|uniref:glycosyltransferase family 39 protein n=1 Tax=Rhizobium sp. 2YAF20 TaxID=3233027 RepID=UPI003F9B5EDB